jgi:hypothetical protein
VEGAAVLSAQEHPNIQHILRYDDNRQDLGGQMAALLAEDLGAGVRTPRAPGLRSS